MGEIDEGDLIFIILGCAVVGSFVAALIYSLVFC